MVFQGISLSVAMISLPDARARSMSASIQRTGQYIFRIPVFENREWRYVRPALNFSSSGAQFRVKQLWECGLLKINQLPKGI